MSFQEFRYIFFLNLAKELAENSHVQDAFVIAVEQQAKERLERLSALRKIKPVDMSTLSQQVSEEKQQHPFLDILKHAMC